MTKNEAYSGLKLNQLADLNNFQHLRPVSQKEKIDQCARKDDIFCHEFLDNVALDAPTGCWTVLKDLNQASVVVRSRLWPGFCSFARANTTIYGGCYYGYGIKSVDMAFMI